MGNQKLLAYLRTSIEKNGYAPSVKEIGKRFGWSSTATTQAKLRALVDEGKIVRVGPRAIRITDEKS